MSDETRLPNKVRITVKRGPVWPGGYLAARPSLDGSRFALAVTPQKLGRIERTGIARVFGEGQAAGLEEGREARLEFDVSEAQWEFPEMRGRRSQILITLSDRPKFMLAPLDWGPVEEVAMRANPGQILKRTGDVLRTAQGAGAARDAWREALEVAGVRAASPDPSG